MFRSQRVTELYIFALLLMIILQGGWSSVVLADFTPAEVLVSPDNILDFEFDYAESRFAWTDPRDGNLWIGNVDRHTGEFVPTSGKGILVDTDTVFKGNGPEWAASLEGPRLVYTKKPPDQAVQLAEATFDGSRWVAQSLVNGQSRINPLASLNPEDVYPTVYYLSFAENADQQEIAWRFLDFPMSEKIVPMSAGATGGRWVSNRRAIVFTAPYGSGRDAFLYDADTDSVEQLTFGEGNEQTIFMWQAPEFNNEYVFFTSVKLSDRSVIRVYRKMDVNQDGNPLWTVYKTIEPPEKGIYFWSPEPFVHNGKSYIFFLARTSPNHKKFSVPAEIWLADLDPVNTFFRNLSSEPRKLRMDPEVFITDQGPYIYYSRYTPGPAILRARNFEGIYRVDTGLGPVMP